MTKTAKQFFFPGFNILLALILAGCSGGSEEPMWLNAENAFQHGAQSPYPTSVTYRQAVLAGFNMNEQGNQITVKPRQIIHAAVSYEYDCQQCKPYIPNQIIVGIAGRSAQVCIYQGDIRAKGSTRFELKAPALSGEYEVRFKPVQASNCSEALQSWNTKEAPAHEAAIGKIIVQQKPKREVEGSSASGKEN